MSDEMNKMCIRDSNDVVDHQQVSMAFENGVKATLTMTAFTAGGGRIMRFFGTTGEIVLDEARDTIAVSYTHLLHHLID